MYEEEIDSCISCNSIVCFRQVDGKLLNELYTKFRRENYYMVHSVYSNGPGAVITFPKEYYVLVKYITEEEDLLLILGDKKSGEEFLVSSSKEYIPDEQTRDIVFL